MEKKPEFHFEELKKLLETDPELRKPSDLQTIQFYLLQHPFFQSIKRDYHINNIVDCAIYFKYSLYQAEEWIFSVNQPSEYFYVLLEGDVAIYKHNNLIRRYKEGVLEECCLVERRKHDTSAVSLKKSHILYIDYQIYSGVFAKMREKRRIAMASFLNIQNAFKHWSKAKLMSLSYYINELELKQDTVIFNLGDPADTIYVVQDGNVLVKDKEFVIASAGDVIGLEDINKDRCRTSKCITQGCCTLLYIFKHDFLEKSKLETQKCSYLKDHRHEKLAKAGKNSGFSIYSYVPEDAKSINLFGIRRPNSVYGYRPSSNISQRQDYLSKLPNRRDSINNSLSVHRSRNSNTLLTPSSRASIRPLRKKVNSSLVPRRLNIYK
jgi:signal-transduction protein with cAMP-binding, CBS, and nucleotidyltransferase domain